MNSVDRSSAIATAQCSLRDIALKIAVSLMVVGGAASVAWLLSVGTPQIATAWGGTLVGFVLLGLVQIFLNKVQTSRSGSRGFLKVADPLYAAYICAMGLMWGSLALLAPSPLNDGDVLWLLTALLMIAMLSVALLLHSQYAFIAHLLALTAPLFLRLSGDSFSTLGLIAVCVAIGVLILLHQCAHRAFSDWLANIARGEALAREHEVIFDTAVEAIFLVKQNRIVKCNQAAAEMLRAAPESIADTPMSVWHEDGAAWIVSSERLNAALPHNRRFSYTTRLRRSDGSLFWAELSAPAMDSENLDTGVVWMGFDISHRLRVEKELRASEARFRRLVSFSSDWYWEQDAELRFVQVSGSRIDQILRSTEESIGKCRWELAHVQGVTDDTWAAHRACLLAHESFNDFVYQVKARDESLHWVSISGCPMYDERGQFCGYHGIGTDITERVQSAERYRHLAHHDPLTGLPNRRLLEDRLHQAAAQARRWNQRVIVMMLDLDGFKSINDSDGHDVGDRVLVAVAQRLRKLVRETDTVARLGGDEFVILLPEVEDPGDALSVAEKILIKLHEPIMTGDRQYSVSTSIGIAIFPDHSEQAESLLGLADAAMYRAKKAGGSACHIAPSANEPQLPLDFRLDIESRSIVQTAD